MDRTERFYKIERLIREQPGISLEALRSRIEVSRATINRDNDAHLGEMPPLSRYLRHSSACKDGNCDE